MSETARAAGPAGGAGGSGSATGAGSRAGRIALVAAALLALAAVGVAIWRSQQEDAAVPAIAADSVQQPAVEEVIARLEARLKTDPKDAEGWRMLGWSYFQTERFAEAATAMKRAAALDPDSAEYQAMLGEALVLASSDGSGIPADAKAAFDRALALDPKDPRARYFQAVAMDLEGRHREALDAWFALLKDTPADAPWAQDVREVIRNVGKANNIEVEQRLAAIAPAPEARGMTTDGAAIASAGIPGPTRAEIAAASQLPQGQQEAMVRGMVDGLEAKLKANPDNAQGWIMLMRSRMQLGETNKAAQALKDSLRAFRNDGATSRQLREAAAALGVSGT